MNAATEFDLGPLTWVKGEIEASLDRAGEALGQFRETGDQTKLKFCRTHVHQVHGALAIVALDGVTQVTEILENLLIAIEEGKQPNSDGNLDAVGRALAAIRQYLDDLMAGEPNQPLRLLPIYQELGGALGGGGRVRSSDLFFPDLSVRPPKRTEPVVRLAPEEFRACLKAERMRFQKGLLAWLRSPAGSPQSTGGLAQMRQALKTIESTQETPAARSFWWISQGFLDTLAARGVAAEQDAKQLCARIDLQIRRLLEGSRNVAERLMRDALFIIGQSPTASSGLAAEINNSFQLTALIPKTESAPTSAPQESALRRLREVIVATEELWNKFCAGSAAALAGFAEQARNCAQITATVGHTDLKRLGQGLGAIAAWLAEQPSRQSEAVAMEVATSILLLQNAQENFKRLGTDFARQVDLMVARLHACISGKPVTGDDDVPLLDEMTRRAQEKLLISQVAREIQNNLAQIEQALDAFFRDPAAGFEPSSLEASLKQIGGALMILGHDKALTSLSECEAQIQRFGDDDYRASEEDFVAVAQQLSTLGFFIDALQTGATDYDVFVRKLKGIEEEPAEEEVAEEVHEEPQSVEAELEQKKENTQALIAALKEAPQDQQLKDELKQNLQALSADADLLADHTLGETAKAALSALEAGDAGAAPELEALNALKPAASEAPVPSAETLKLAQASHEEIDAELLEIFLEEAKEVLETIESELANLCSEPHNVDTLTTIRRCAHTLKGSGRMVGLKDLGEVAWEVEQTLNMWLRQEMDVTTDVLEMIGLTQEIFAVWVGELENNTGNAPDASGLIHLAQRLRGVESAVAPAPATTPAAVTEPAPAVPEEVSPGAAASEPAVPDFGATFVGIGGLWGQPEAEAPAEKTPEPEPELSLSLADLGMAESPIPAQEVAVQTIDVTAPAEQFAPADEAASVVSELEAGFDIGEPVAEIAPSDAQAETMPDYLMATVVGIENIPAEIIAAEAPEIESTRPSIDLDLTAEVPSAATGEDAPEIVDLGEPGEIDFSFDIAGDAADGTLAVAEEEAAEIVAELPAGEPDNAVPAAVETPAPVIPDEQQAGGEPPVVDEITFDLGDIAEAVDLAPLADVETDVVVESAAESRDIEAPLESVTVELPEATLQEPSPSATVEIVAEPVAEDDFSFDIELAGGEEEVTAASPDAAEAGAPEVPPPTHATEDAIPAEAPAEVFAVAVDELPVAESVPEDEALTPPVEGIAAPAFDLAAEVVAAMASRELVPAALEAAPPIDEPAPQPPEAVAASPTLYDIFREEARGHLDTLQQTYAELEADPHSPTTFAMTRAAHTLGGIAATVGLMPINKLAITLEHALLRRDNSVQPDSIEGIETVRQTILALEDMFVGLAKQITPELPQVLVDALENIFPVPTPTVESALLSESLTDSPAMVPVVEEIRIPLPAAAVDTTATVDAQVGAVAKVAARLQETPRLQDELDDQLLPIFLEEAQDIVQGFAEQLREWRLDPLKSDPPRALARLLHTFKGGARMAGAMNLGEMTHTLETSLEEALRAGHLSLPLLEHIESGCDTLTLVVDRLLAGESPTLPEPAAVESHEVEAPAQAVAQEPAHVDENVPAAVQAPAQAAAPQQDHEGADRRAQIRVRADLVDRLVNEAGELSIARARIEGEMRSLKASLLDLTENVIRLRRQLREIEIQAEGQIQARVAQTQEGKADFDPLELDRFSRFQELTRFMAESVNDVATVQQNLLKNLDDANAAIIAQARMNRALQQDLMGIRMVPFASQSDRLYRIVRQTGKDLNKRANLDIRGGHVELDRSVLDKMMAPIEHMLRNAISHGIEDRESRVAHGKSDVGEVLLALTQEGNEIVVTMTDDGRGLDAGRIRSRAESAGLLQAGETIEDVRLFDFIFQPGFSTATEVTQVSGRGVGMDVVKSEVTSLGGRIEISTTPGKGTTFRLYLPLTLAVTQTLLVRAAGTLYAIPSTMIEQVLEVKEAGLNEIRNNSEATWMGNRYPFQFLPHLLGDVKALPETRRRYWVLLLRSGTQRVAVQVDELAGNQEVVVKNIGAQLARVVGIAGATVLGDGRVVLILNPVALASRQQAVMIQSAPGEVPVVAEVPVEPVQAAQRTTTLPTVMVVDDSLTVRKITGRLLAREGYQVITAKDGVDALEHLVETIPDVMLSDIEMPRMDGFDLVRNVRADARLQNLPIIMITSRTADKHRNYALEIGANEYLGKPYDEDTLLKLIGGFIKNKSS